MTILSYSIVYDVIIGQLRCRLSRHPKSNFDLSSSSYMSGDFIYPKLHRYHFSLKSYDPRVKMTPPQYSYSLKSPVAVVLMPHDSLFMLDLVFSGWIWLFFWLGLAGSGWVWLGTPFSSYHIFCYSTWVHKSVACSILFLAVPVKLSH